MTIIDDGQCKVKFDSGGYTADVDLHELLPLDDISQGNNGCIEPTNYITFFASFVVGKIWFLLDNNETIIEFIVVSSLYSP